MISQKKIKRIWNKLDGDINYLEFKKLMEQPEEFNKIANNNIVEVLKLISRSIRPILPSSFFKKVNNRKAIQESNRAQRELTTRN